MDILSFLLGKNSSGGGSGSKYAPKWVSFGSYLGEDLSYETENLNTINLTSFNSMFYGCKNVLKFNCSNFNTINATSMSSMFYGCWGVTEVDLSNAETPNVNNFNSMFQNCYALMKIDIRKMTFENEPSLSGMFYGIPDSCLIIVKSDIEKTFLKTNFSNLINIKTVSEYEGV